MSKRRFQVEALTGPIVELSEAESRHALKVLRLGAGDEIIVFDGAGRQASARIEETRGGLVRARIVEVVVHDVQRTPLLELTVAMPKGQRGDWLIEKCSELGVSSVRLLDCRRAVAVPGESKIERWRRKTKEAAKQSGQARVMNVEPPVNLEEAIRIAGQCDDAWFGEARESAHDLYGAFQSAIAARSVMLFIGPEGGFTRGETEALRAAGIFPVRWAAPVLRIETAAVAAAAVWSAWMEARHGDFDEVPEAP